MEIKSHAPLPNRRHMQHWIFVL